MLEVVVVGVPRQLDRCSAETVQAVASASLAVFAFVFVSDCVTARVAPPGSDILLSCSEHRLPAEKCLERHST
jgi:hypothetical protein